MAFRKNDPNVSTSDAGATEDAPTADIALWGMPGSGKTTYTAALFDYIESLKRPNIAIQEADITKDDMWETTAVRGSIAQLQSGKWLDPNRPDEVTSYAYYLERLFGEENKQSLRRIKLLFVDAAGEWYRNPKKTQENQKANLKGRADPLETLTKTRGIICLFDGRLGLLKNPSAPDPQRVPPTRAELEELAAETVRQFGVLVNSLQTACSRKNAKGQRRIGQPLAAIVTKADIEGVWEHRTRQADIVEWFEQYYGGVVDIISNNWDSADVLFDMVSTVGVTGDRSNTDRENRILKNVPRAPYNLYRPVGWLASRAYGDTRWETV